MLIPNSWFIPPCYLFLLVTISLFLKFVFLGYHLLLLLFHFFCLFGAFPFSSQWAWLEVCGFSLSFQKKENRSWFYLSFMLFFWSLFYFLSDLHYSLFLLTLDFVFLILLGGILGCWFQIFLVSWNFFKLINVKDFKDHTCIFIFTLKCKRKQPRCLTNESKAEHLCPCHPLSPPKYSL